MKLSIDNLKLREKRIHYCIYAFLAFTAIGIICLSTILPIYYKRCLADGAQGLLDGFKKYSIIAGDLLALGYFI
jgi:hypothetical protein